MRGGKKSKEELLEELTQLRRRIEELETHGTEARLHAIFEFSEDAIFIKDRNLRYTQVNPAFERLFGIPLSKLIDMSAMDLFGEEAAASLTEADRRVLGGETLRQENTVPVKGVPRTFHLVKGPIRDQSGAIMGLYGIARDVTERRAAEESLKKSQQLLDKILSASPLGISYVENGKLKWSNQAMVEMFGYEYSDDYLGKSLREFYASEEEYRRVVKEFFTGLEQGRPVATEALLRRKDGSTFTGQLRVSAPDPKAPRSGTIATISDISASKRAEMELLESEERYRLLAQHSLTGIYIFQDSRFVYGNDRLAEIVGYPLDEIIGKPFWELVHPEDRELVKARGLARSSGLGPEPHYEFRVLSKKGETRWVEVLATTVMHRGRVAVMGNMADITQRKLADQALREGEERFRTLVQESFDGIFVQKGILIVFANRRLHEMLGYDEGELEGRQHWIVYHPDYQGLTRERARARMRGEEVPSRYEVRLQRKDGSSFPGEISARAIRFGEEAGIQVWIRDITDRKRAEEELIRIEKLESMGILAGGIAHDFNNILTAILGNISLAKLHSEPGDKVFKRLDAGEKACQKARGLTHQLLTFSKGGTPIKKILVISDLLKDVCQFTQRGSKITCEISAPEDLWPVEVDAGQIWQVINNLVVNADQAMPEGGTVRVTAENVVIGPQNAYNLPHAEYVKISVLDEGIGIAEQNISKIFDPYFTTKERGSGLGLATAYSIIKNHRGMITVESVLNKGTAFHIFLPASKRKTEAEEVPSGRVLTGKGKILVMDDEAQIRDEVGDLLTALGYGVCLAKDGVEAVDLYRAARDSSEPFDAVIMDLTVPGGVGGKEAVRKLLEIDPGVKAIVSSGYSNDPVMSDPAAYGFGGVVVKPYNAEELGKALYKILRQDSQRAASSA